LLLAAAAAVDAQETAVENAVAPVTGSHWISFEESAFFKGLFSGARIRNDKYCNCQNTANDQHQENRPA
jgi:hypothetical protein